MSSHSCNLVGAIKLKADVTQKQLNKALKALLKEQEIDELPTIDPDTQTIEVDFEYWGEGGSGDSFAEDVAAILTTFVDVGQRLILIDTDNCDSSEVRVPYFIGDADQRQRAQVLYGIECMEEWVSPILGEEAIEYVRSIVLSKASTTVFPVKHWDAYRDDGAAMSHMLAVTDERAKSGQIFLDLEKIDGGYDDVLSVTMEVITNPLNAKENAPAAHVHFNDDNVAFTLIKVGEEILLRPETNVELESCSIEVNGITESMYWIRKA